MSSTEIDSIVHNRYSAAAGAREEALCCPVDYDPRYLDAIPQEVIDRDYGCGDPSRYVRQGETVLDLGSGGGKICFIAAQVVGPAGRVIGVDMNDDMLDLARRSQGQVAEKIGYNNVQFRKGKIQDLQIDRQRVDDYLREHPIDGEAAWNEFEQFLDQMRRQQPLVADDSVDVVISNCVLNLVANEEKERLFAEIFRVLRPGGRAVISDIVSDQPVPPDMQQDPHLWSGCISGAFQENRFLQAFVAAGFGGVQLAVLQSEPWRVVRDITVRSATVIAYKCPADGDPPDPADPSSEAVLYRGPYASVTDERGQIFRRGVRMLVSPATARRLAAAPYRDHFWFADRAAADDSPSAGTQSAGTQSAESAGCCGGQPPVAADAAKALPTFGPKGQGGSGCC